MNKINVDLYDFDVKSVHVASGAILVAGGYIDKKSKEYLDLDLNTHALSNKFIVLHKIYTETSAFITSKIDIL